MLRPCVGPFVRVDDAPAAEEPARHRPLYLRRVRVLVTGATGYVGGRLVSALLRAGHRVRVLARDPARVAGRSWAARVEVVRGDALAPDGLGPAVAGIEVAYYLIHGMAETRSSGSRDLTAAANFARAARAAGVGRIVYLGGLGDPSRGASSRHLASRRATGDRLRELGPPVTELRAGLVVGAGSLAFEMTRYLVERSPVVACPRWAFNRTQPIGIADVLGYLVATLEAPATIGETVELGGADVVRYRDMMVAYARRRGLRRLFVPVPLLGPRLSSHGIHWLTPISLDVARPLVEGLRTGAVVRSDLARRLFPDVRPLTHAQALDEALAALDRGEVDSSWSDALASSVRDRRPVALRARSGLVLERRALDVAAPAGAVFRSFTGLGGERGWLTMDGLWRLRGLMDRAMGGVGLRRGRRDPDVLRPGDAVDFWRVEEVEPDALLRLRAEMRLPGRAWLEFRALPAAGGHTRLVQTAYFAPRGLVGRAYWWSLYPLHKVMFSRMARRIGDRALRLAAEPDRRR